MAKIAFENLKNGQQFTYNGKNYEKRVTQVKGNGIDWNAVEIGPDNRDVKTVWFGDCEVEIK